jgi:hypothetical protein
MALSSEQFDQKRTGRTDAENKDTHGAASLP